MFVYDFFPHGCIHSSIFLFNFLLVILLLYPSLRGIFSFSCWDFSFEQRKLPDKQVAKSQILYLLPKRFKKQKYEQRINAFPYVKNRASRKKKNDAELLTVHFHFPVCLGDEEIVIRIANSLATKTLRLPPLSMQRCF